jgi:hypothetical protein
MWNRLLCGLKGHRPRKSVRASISGQNFSRCIRCGQLLTRRHE